MTRDKNYVKLPYSPDIKGLKFRKFRGEEDYPEILRVFEKMVEADNLESAKTLEDIKREYEHLTNCNPYEDMLLAEFQKEVIGYSRVYWLPLHEDRRNYIHLVNLSPEWRNKGIMEAMTRFNEERLKEIADNHQDDIEKMYCCYCSEDQNEWSRILENFDYKIARYYFKMVNNDLDNIAEYPLPEGIEVREVEENQYRKIWEAAKEAFKDEWNEPEWQEEWFYEFLESPNFQPELWQVAWDGDEVVGMVLNYIDEKENEKYDRKRGYTENICVRKQWRGQGIAKALISSSLKILKDEGMEEAALGVDAENPSGALHLYKKMGFEKKKTSMTYQKLLKK